MFSCKVLCSLSNSKPFSFYRGCTKRQENVTRSEEMAALVLTALSISPVFKDVDQSKLEYRNLVTKII